MSPNAKRRSPIKGGLLRLPGQSVSEHRQRVYETKIEDPVVMAGGAFSLGVFEAIGGFYGWPRMPWLGVILASAAVAYMTWIVYRMRPQMRSLRLAIDGERAVGLYLEGLRVGGYKVFHDVPGDGFNIDHVVIGPGGVFSIETKTWSLPAQGRPTIDFDGESLRFPGRQPDRNPLDQAKAQASWLGELLHESTARVYSVQPVVLFPGWYIRKTKRVGRTVWPLNPKAFPKFLQRAPRALSDEMISMGSLHLSRYVRTTK